MINIPSNLEESIQLEWENYFLVGLSLFDTEGLTFCSQQIGVETLQSLQRLSISNANVDSFSQWLTQLTQHAELRQLNLTMTDLIQLPAWITNLSHLEHLDLTANRLTDLPAWMNHLKKLKILTISENQLYKMPDVIGELSSMQELCLYRNPIKNIPDWIDSLSELTLLQLPECELIDISESLGHLEKLKEIEFEFNKIKKLPKSIGELSALESLNLMYNDIEELPDSIGNLNNLKSLNLMRNSLTTLPLSMTNLQRECDVSLLANRIGTIPKSLVNRFDFEGQDIKKPIALPGTVSVSQESILEADENEPKFWMLIEDAWNDIGGEKEFRLKMATKDLYHKEAEQLSNILGIHVISKLDERLSKLSREELISFDRVLERKLFDLDRSEVHQYTGGSDDGFLYARGFIVGMGKDYYNLIHAHPEYAMVDIEAESICYLPDSVYEKYFEQEFGKFPRTEISRESGSSPQFEYDG